MLFIKTEAKDSLVAGTGVFALEPASKGQVIGILGYGTEIMTEEQYQDEQRNGNELVVKTGARWVDKYFLYKDKIEDEEYLNYSRDPNVLYHCGICFALRDIDPGEELTVDYRYFLAKDDVHSFVDSSTGEKVDGISGKEALLESTKQLLTLLEE